MDPNHPNGSDHSQSESPHFSDEKRQNHHQPFQAGWPDELVKKSPKHIPTTLSQY
jgi:hypothetical protein